MQALRQRNQGCASREGGEEVGQGSGVYLSGHSRGERKVISGCDEAMLANPAHIPRDSAEWRLSRAGTCCVADELRGGVTLRIARTAVQPWLKRWANVSSMLMKRYLSPTAMEGRVHPALMQ